MRKLTSFFLNKVLNRKVYDEFDDYLGDLHDIYVICEKGYPRAIGYQLKKGREIIDCGFKSIDFCEVNDKLIINTKGFKEIIPRNYTYLLSKNLLNKKIVDINGKKVVKVDDLRLASIAGELRVLAVDSGIIARARKIGSESIVAAVYSMFKKQMKDNLVLWDSVQSLEMNDQDKLQLDYSYDRLSKLHPADLADIIEELDNDNRRKIIENLDSNLASDILQEIDPEIQSELLKVISESRVSEILVNMPNDEIADILEEVDEEQANKILLNFEKEDEEEVRRLMKYEDNLVGSYMNKEFISFNLNISVEETIDILRESKPDDEVSYYIYILDYEDKLKGIVSLRDLVVSDPKAKIKDIMNQDINIVRDIDEIETAFDVLIKYNLTAIPVMDREERLCGIVLINDILEELIQNNWKKKLKKIG